MSHNRMVKRLSRITSYGAAVWLLAASGRGAEPDRAKLDKRACAIAYKNARQQQQANHLRAAEELAESCAKAACGAVIRRECADKYNQLENDIPTVVPMAIDETGATVVDVQVKVDGEPLTSKLDGHSLPIDPGVHEFSFAAPNGVVTERIMVVQGQRNHPITVTIPTPAARHQKGTLAAAVTLPPPASNRTALEPHTAPAKPSTEKSAPPKRAAEKASPQEETETVAVQRKSPGMLPFIVGGAGLLALGAGGAATIWGNKDNDALNACTPDCSHSSVTRVKTLYTMADISFGVGAAALGVSAFLFATSGGAVTKEKSVGNSGYSFDVQPTRNGAFATVSGQF